MQTGLLFNGLICLIVAGVSFWVSRVILKEKNRSFAEFMVLGFWFSVGLTWLLVGVGLFLYEGGYPLYDKLLNRYGVQAFIYLQLSFGVAYAVYRFYSKWLVGVVVLLSCLTFSAVGYSFLILPGGFLFGSDSYFSVEYQINPISWNFFQIILGVGVIFLIYDILKNLITKLRKKHFQSAYFFTSLSILVYAVIGFFDNQGFNATWIMVLFRSIIVLSVLLTYLTYSRDNLLEEK